MFYYIQVTFISKAAQQEPLSFGDYIYPQWGNTIAWCIVAFPCVVMVGVFLYRYCSQGGYQVNLNIPVGFRNIKLCLHFLICH